MWNGVSAARRTLRKPTRGDDFGQRLRWLAPGRLLLGKADLAGAHRLVQRFGQAQHEITARRRAAGFNEAGMAHRGSGAAALGRAG